MDEVSSSLESDDPPSLEQISEVFRQKRSLLLGRLLEGFIEARYKEAEQDQACCPARISIAIWWVNSAKLRESPLSLWHCGSKGGIIKTG